ncbi:hypothetical protein DRN69_08725 [Candidatus Pacearchaeota archaeon]|nr:MAG: hypothetical protein DRN69_08725 [Candidatus Pacearchaeota archaeon]
MEMLIYLIISLVITIVSHELAHAIVAKLCKVDVITVSLGFFKPYLQVRFLNIKFRITPFLFGGFTKLKGEDEKIEGGFLNASYSKKVYILLAGVTINFIIAIICSLILFNSVTFGLKVYNDLLYSIFFETRGYIINSFVFMLGLMNYFSALLNILPFPALDGGQVVVLALEPLFKQNFIKFYLLINRIGFIVINILQLIIIMYFIL